MSDIDECAGNATICGTDNFCENFIGGYSCNSSPRDIKKLKLDMIIIGLSASFGSLFLVIGAWLFFIMIKRRNQIKLKEKHFKQNGGLLLEQRLTTFDGSVDTSKLFNSNELDKATDHFNIDRILGQGGQATEEGISLASYFIISMEENKVCDILDAQVKLGKEEEIMVMANLAIRCLNLQGKQRPTMKQVAMELEGIRAPEKINNVHPSAGNLVYWDQELFEAWDGSTFNSTSTPSTDTQPLII
ncbi:hypothetical protein QYF36_022221 [Acer negundo]|nr:hypothetical protein QYF36_022221 [Acer negundo]